MKAGITIKGSQGPYLVDSGSVSTDRYGLSTTVARYWAAKPSALDNIGLALSPHPRYPTLVAESRSPSQGPAGSAYLDVQYVGILGGTSPTPLYDIDSGLTEFPIEKHPNFYLFGGTAKHPAKGAVFNEDGTFKNFTVDAPDYLRGVTTFQMPVAIVRETKVDNFGFTRPIGQISTPPQFVSSAPGQNWIVTGAKSDRRGNVFMVVTEWKSSGPVRWSSQLFS